MTGLPPPPTTLLDGASLFLDLDGTLVPFAAHPDRIDVDPDLRDILRDLQRRLDGRLAVISGRALDNLAGHLAVDGLPLGGSHGLERRTAGHERDPVEAPPGHAAALAEVSAFASDHGLVVETKPAGIALHFRGAPGIEDAADTFMAGVAERHGFQLLSGSMVRELRPAGRHKGDVVARFMTEQPFRSGRPVFVGDDITDEDAFATCIALGGTAILVGDDRPTHAQYRLASVVAVKEWLRG